MEARPNEDSQEDIAATVTILSTADFDNPIWTNKQHIATGLAQDRKVFYIDSLGLRSPRLNPVDIRRILRRACRGSSSRTKRRSPGEAQNIRVISPRVVPWHGRRVARWINRWLLRYQVLRQVPVAERDVLWTFSPITYGLERYFSKVVYHSVDLLHTFPGTPSRAILSDEKALIGRCDAVIASSSGVRSHLVASGAQGSMLWENVADVELFGQARQDLPERRAIFAGNLTPTKIDFELLAALADTNVEIVLAGPTSFDGTEPGDAFASLTALPNVRYLGMLNPADLAHEVGNSMVGLIPYRVSEHTAGIFPLKVYEYLSAGLAVVSTPIRSLCEAQLPAGVTLSSGRDFVATVGRALSQHTNEASLDRSRSAESFSWKERIRQANELLVSLMGGVDPLSNQLTPLSGSCREES